MSADMVVDDMSDLFNNLSIQPHIGSRYLTLLGSVEPNLIVNCSPAYNNHLINAMPIFTCTLRFNKAHLMAWHNATNLFYDMLRTQRYTMTYYKVQPASNQTYYDCVYYVEIYAT